MLPGYTANSNNSCTRGTSGSTTATQWPPGPGEMQSTEKKMAGGLVPYAARDVSLLTSDILPSEQKPGEAALLSDPW